jgi:hypothetical protein
MRKISFTILAIAALGFCLKANGQTATTTANTDSTLGIIAHASDSTGASDSTTAGDYFPGKWNVTVFGTPNGDAKMMIVLERKDGKLGGSVQDSTGKDISKITQADEQGKTITLGFNAEGYDVTLTLDPVDENNVKGSLMGMFDAKGIRVKETANP